jgi:hypothetical protein
LKRNKGRNFTISQNVCDSVVHTANVFLSFGVFPCNPDAGSNHMLSSSEAFGTRGELLPGMLKIISGSAEGPSVFRSLQCRPQASGSKTELLSTTMSTELLVSTTQRITPRTSHKRKFATLVSVPQLHTPPKKKKMAVQKAAHFSQEYSYLESSNGPRPLLSKLLTHNYCIISYSTLYK